jgi:hypothetical protein
MSVLELDNDKIVLSGLGVFQDFELKYIFDTEEASIINLLNNFNVQTVFFESSCNTNKTIISIYESDVKITPSNNNVKISATLNARINEDTCGYDLKDDDAYIELEDKFTNIIEQKINNVITKLQSVKSNALSIGKTYYNKYRIQNEYLWTTEDFSYDLNLKINKKGLIFEME